MKLFNLEMNEDFRFTRLTMSEIDALSIGPIALPLARSHCSLIRVSPTSYTPLAPYCSLRARALRCAHSFAGSLAHSLAP